MKSAKKEETRALCLEPTSHILFFGLKQRTKENIELLAYSEAEEYNQKS
jgi:hypothetical protein